MQCRKVTAVVRRERLADVERGLLEAGVTGITVTPIKGFGEYANYFRGDMLVPHVRIEIFTSRGRVKQIADTILACACTECEGDGFLAVLPVESIVRIRTKTSMDQEAM